MIAQAIFKHPDRRSRLRDLCILRTALDECDAEARSRLDDSIEAGGLRQEAQEMVARAAGVGNEVGSFRHYVLLSRTRRWADRWKSARLRRIPGIARTGVSGELRRIRNNQLQGNGSSRIHRLASYGLGLVLSGAAIALNLDIYARTFLRMVAAVVETPAALAGDRWRVLLQPPGFTDAIPGSCISTRGTERLLRVLSRLPGVPWRSTCLYRCVAVCILLRSWRVPAVIRIGVTGGAATNAHAWVETPAGEPLYEKSSPYTALR
jgi:hypothetical protein